MDLPLRRTRRGIELHVRLTPRSTTDRIEGIAEGADGVRHVAARVRALPEKGAANAALEKLVAAWLGVPPGSVSVTSGGASRLKSVGVAGDPDVLVERVAALLRPD